MDIYINDLPRLIQALNDYVNWLQEPNFGDLGIEDIDIEMLKAAAEIVWIYGELEY